MPRTKASLSSLSNAFSSFGPSKDFPPGSDPDASTGKVPSTVRHAPIASKFSRPNPNGSIREWHDAQAGFLRCASICWRNDADCPTFVSSKAGTDGGGGGGGALSRFSRIHLPRSTGEVRVEYDEIVSTLACARIPPPRLVLLTSTRRNSGPATSLMP